MKKRNFSSVKDLWFKLLRKNKLEPIFTLAKEMQETGKSATDKETGEPGEKYPWTAATTNILVLTKIPC